MNTNLSSPVTMDLITLTPDYFGTCCCNLTKDVALNFVNQAPCPAPAKKVLLGYVVNRVFRTNGVADRAIGVCGRHYNQLIHGSGVATVYFTNVDLNKENNMTCDCTDLDPNGWCACMHEAFNKEHGITMVTDNDAFIAEMRALVTTKLAAANANPKGYIEQIEADIEKEFGVTVDVLVEEGLATDSWTNPVKPKGWTNCGKCRKLGSKTPWHKNTAQVQICYHNNHR